MFSDFQTGICVLAHITLDIEQLMSDTRSALAGTIASPQGSDGKVIAASQVYELLTMIHDTLDSAVSTQSGNMACILAYHFNSVSMQCHEVLVSQFPFLHNIKESVLPSEACLYGGINWSVGQAHHQFSLGLTQSSSSMIVPECIYSSVMSRNGLYHSLIVLPWWRSLTLILNLTVTRVARNQVGCVYCFHRLSEEGESWGSGIPDVLQSSNSSHSPSSSSVVQAGTHNFVSVEKHYFQ